jgi:hypothetical protein
MPGRLYWYRRWVGFLACTWRVWLHILPGKPCQLQRDALVADGAGTWAPEELRVHEVVRGDSSTGKTRAAYEAIVRGRLARWWLEYPLGKLTSMCCWMQGSGPRRFCSWLSCAITPAALMVAPGCSADWPDCWKIRTGS